MRNWLWLSVIVILLDQVTKQVAQATLALGEVVQVLPFFDFTLRTNPGAAFSFLSDQGGWQRWFFILLGLGVSGAMSLWLVRLKREEQWTALTLSLIIGGALGNVIDRILQGEVIDFILVHYQNHYWPAFNIADSAICVGVAVMLVDALILSKRAR